MPACTTLERLDGYGQCAPLNGRVVRGRRREFCGLRGLNVGDVEIVEIERRPAVLGRSPGSLDVLRGEGTRLAVVVRGHEPSTSNASCVWTSGRMRHSE